MSAAWATLTPRGGSPCPTEPDLGIHVVHDGKMHAVELVHGGLGASRIAGRLPALAQARRGTRRGCRRGRPADGARRPPRSTVEGRHRADPGPASNDRGETPTSPDTGRRRAGGLFVERDEDRIDIGQAALEESADEHPDKRAVGDVAEARRALRVLAPRRGQVLSELAEPASDRKSREQTRVAGEPRIGVASAIDSTAVLSPAYSPLDRVALIHICDRLPRRSASHSRPPRSIPFREPMFGAR